MDEYIEFIEQNLDKINWYTFGVLHQEDYTYYLEQIENNTSYILK